VLADRLGLGDALSAQIPPAGERLPLHDRGTVLTQAMLMLAAGGESCAHIEALRGQDRLFGHVPSDSTVYRTFRQIDPGTLGRRTRPAKRSRACYGRATPGANSTSDHLPHEISRPATQVAARESGRGVGGKGN
jgi:hypothetical protein